MKYDPNNELSDEQIDKLSDGDFFEYLDSKAKYLNQFTKPLGEYHTKRYVSLAAKDMNRELSNDEFITAKDIGKEGDSINQKRIIDKMNEKGLAKPDKHVKNVKTYRTQWFD